MAYDAKKIYYRFDDHLSRLVLDYEASRQISPESENLYHGLPTAPYDEGLFVEHNVKRGLRNADGSGVVAGLTRISDVHGYNKVDGKVVPDQGKLTLRGYSIEDLVNNAQAEDRYGYEEVAYLLITGSLPTKEELDGFCERLGAFRHLSDEYVREFPMTTVSSSIMNVLQRAVLLLYAFDAEPDAITPEHEIDVAISMLARLPRIAAFAHMASVAKRRGSEVHVPHPTPGLSTAETILQVLRGGMAFTRDEAMLLDVMLMLHAEHGGGNNSTFACRVLSSSATDRIPPTPRLSARSRARATAAPMPRSCLCTRTSAHMSPTGRTRTRSRPTWARSSTSRPSTARASSTAWATPSIRSATRAPRSAAVTRAHWQPRRTWAKSSHSSSVSSAWHPVMRDHGMTKPICANIDLYTGFIYKMLGVPETLLTPLFAVARMAGWSAHRMEELFCAHRIIRPAYRPVIEPLEYKPLADR